jgi:two-component system LytT family response regulator
MSRFRVLVADDEPLALRMVANLVRDDDEIESVVECAESAEAGQMIRKLRPDIVFLDIEMPEVNGFDIARDLAEDGPVVVFVTAFSRYAPDAFGVGASDYVLKPFSDERFAEALTRAKRRVRERRLGLLASQLADLSSELREDEDAEAAETSKLTRLVVKAGDRTLAIAAGEINWIEAEDYYVRVHSTRGRHLVRIPLATLERRLDRRTFLRVHRAAIVNVDAVRELRQEGVPTLVLADGTEIVVSRSRRSAVEAALAPHLRRHRSG